MLILDAMGAAATSFATHFLLASERVRTGLPTGTLTVLALAALSFAIFDLVSLAIARSLAIPLRWIACCNLTYCLLTLALVVLHRNTVTPLGLVYFFSEIAIIVPLACWEWRLAGRCKPE
ncbi:hypothetical protein SH501x_004242 [Pirellulaceae bacterium SH501]